jgi:hypothetical protein
MSCTTTWVGAFCLEDLKKLAAVCNRRRLLSALTHGRGDDDALWKQEWVVHIRATMFSLKTTFSGCMSTRSL